MRKWGIGIWLLVGLFAAATGLLGTWLFRERMQYGFSQLLGVGISGTTLGFFTAFRAETIRWQDNHSFQLIVETLRRDSSLKNLNWLYRQLKEDRRHGHRNTK